MARSAPVRASISAALAALATACSTDTPTYTREVAPLVAEHCTTCHRSGGAAFSLETYDAVKGYAPSIARVVRTGEMPPWPPETNAACPPFVGDRHLAAGDVATIADWAEGGTPMGDPNIHAPAEPAPLGTLDGISVELGPDQPYQPADGDDYRCFLLDAKLTHDEFITAYRVTAGAGVHHLQLWEINDDADAEALAAVDAAAPGAGFPCNDNPGASARYLTVWGPSDPVRKHPAGTGIRVRAGKKLYLQIHYHHAPGPDQTSIGLQLADHVDEEASMIAMGVTGFVLPPRTPATTVHTEVPLGHDAKVWGIRGHMHTLGSEIHVRRRLPAATPADVVPDQCMLSIPKWDANWQLMYFYEQPLQLHAGDSVTLDCTYDTRTRNDEVHDGMTADDEMCNAYLYVTGAPID